MQYADVHFEDVAARLCGQADYYFAKDGPKISRSKKVRRLSKFLTSDQI